MIPLTNLGASTLGIDYGRAHIGVAIGDMNTKISMPLKSYDNLSSEDLINEIRKVILSYNISTVVVGVPITWPEERSKPGVREEAETFAKNISEQFSLPVELIDERYTSEAAKKLLHENPQSDEHALSAMLILQTYFDRQAK